MLDPLSRATMRLLQQCKDERSNSYGCVQNGEYIIFYHVCKDIIRVKHHTCEPLTKEGAKQAFKAGGPVYYANRHTTPQKGSPNKSKMRAQHDVREDTYIDPRQSDAEGIEE